MRLRHLDKIKRTMSNALFDSHMNICFASEDINAVKAHWLLTPTQSPPVTWILDSLCSLCNTEAMLCPAVTGFAPTRDSCPCYDGTGLIWILRARQTQKVTPTHTKS